MFVFTGDSIKLSAPRQSASVYISRESSAAVDAVFSCSVEMDYAPSSVNYVKFYLLSDSEDLSGPLDGYFLRLGYSDKTLSLYRQDGEVIKKLASAVEGLLDSGTPKFTFRVERRGESLWTLYYRDDNARNADFVNLSSVEDGTFTHASFMGVAIKFTSTRNEAFRFFNLHFITAENISYSFGQRISLHASDLIHMLVFSYLKQIGLELRIRNCRIFSGNYIMASGNTCIRIYVIQPIIICLEISPSPTKEFVPILPVHSVQPDIAILLYQSNKTAVIQPFHAV